MKLKSRALAAIFCVIAASTVGAQMQSPTLSDVVSALERIAANNDLGAKSAALDRYIDALRNIQKTLPGESPLSTDSGNAASVSEPAASDAVSTMNEPAVPSLWIYDSDSDPISDDRIHFFVLPAIEGKSRYGDAPVLVLRWRGGETEAYVNWYDYLGLDDTSVTWRLDAGSPQTRRLDLSTDNEATFFPEATSRRLIYDILSGEQLIVRTTPYAESPITAIFDVRGLRALVESIPDLAEWLSLPSQTPKKPH